MHGEWNIYIEVYTSTYNRRNSIPKAMKYIRLFEAFKKSFKVEYKQDVDVTFRFLLKKGVSAETVHRKIIDRFIKRYNPPFVYGDILYHTFDINKVADIPVKDRIESEYSIRATVKLDIRGDAPMTPGKMNKMIRRGITMFLKLEEDRYFAKEVESSVVVSYDIYPIS